jgi:hypothetical protein
MVPSRENTDFSATWETAGMKEGIYTARASFDYGGEEPAVSEKDFRVGDVLIKIVNIVNNDTEEGGISRFNIEIESFWNSPITGVYATLSVKEKNGNSLGDSKSPSVDIMPWSKQKLEIFWDTAGKKAGVYDATITVFYANKTVEKTIETRIVAPQKADYLIYTIIIAIVAIAGAAAAIMLRRRHKKKA